MLQHALLTPKPGHLNASSAGQATYADLFHLAVAAVDRASATRPDSLSGIALEMRGIEMFLLATARHLQQVVPLAPPSPAANKLLTVLLHTRPIPVRTGAWAEAARAVAITGELLATHHTDRTAPVTPEMSELYRTRSQGLALGKVFALLLAGCAGGRDLTRHAAVILQQPGTVANRPERTAHLTRINDLERLVGAVAHHTQAGLWQVEHSVTNSGELDLLTPAAPHLSARVAPRPFDDSLSAVQVVRRIVYRQAQRLEPASPGSLNDLAQVAAVATDPDAEWIQNRNRLCATGLERVQLAHFRDQLASAHQAWTAAPDALTTSIRGLTKAPASLAAAFQEIHDHLDDPHVAAALVVALPQLGNHAGSTLTRLGSEGSLVSAGREPGALSIAWRPITPGQTRRLAAGYAAAGRATAAPAATYRELQVKAADQPRPGQLQTVEGPRNGRSRPGQQRTP